MATTEANQILSIEIIKHTISNLLGQLPASIECNVQLYQEKGEWVD